MKKQPIHIYIDATDYVSLRQLDLNISETVRRLIKGYLSQENAETDKDKLNKQISEAQQQIANIRQDISMWQIQIQKIEDEEEKEIAERELKDKQFVKGVKASGIMRDLI